MNGARRKHHRHMESNEENTLPTNGHCTLKGAGSLCGWRTPEGAACFALPPPPKPPDQLAKDSQSQQSNSKRAQHVARIGHDSGQLFLPQYPRKHPRRGFSATRPIQRALCERLGSRPCRRSSRHQHRSAWLDLHEAGPLPLERLRSDHPPHRRQSCPAPPLRHRLSQSARDDGPRSLYQQAPRDGVAAQQQQEQAQPVP